eukprot:CAMPEP_0172725534 /NCGR_PEP_ID=MMETSP1074-20121228/88616_1 /TAXON_ID=2916 /ORGANISM="Ceratium fusus, Strain PA161109" /LENGTH=68 /DNA_ID=CAMNT_0013552339 /DNA_START=77 /DNA_END=283 /DNA_ORIENTATION=+
MVRMSKAFFLIILLVQGIAERGEKSKRMERMEEAFAEKTDKPTMHQRCGQAPCPAGEAAKVTPQANEK